MELTLLPDGIYERVISDELGKVLDEEAKKNRFGRRRRRSIPRKGPVIYLIMPAASFTVA